VKREEEITNNNNNNNNNHSLYTCRHANQVPLNTGHVHYHPTKFSVGLSGLNQSSGSGPVTNRRTNRTKPKRGFGNYVFQTHLRIVLKYSRGFSLMSLLIQLLFTPHTGVLKVALPRVHSSSETLPLFDSKLFNNTIQSDKDGLQKIFKLLSSMFDVHLTSSHNHNFVFR
jgi:hypothetical protein